MPTIGSHPAQPGLPKGGHELPQPIRRDLAIGIGECKHFRPVAYSIDRRHEIVNLLARIGRRLPGDDDPAVGPERRASDADRRIGRVGAADSEFEPRIVLRRQ